MSARGSIGIVVLLGLVPGCKDDPVEPAAKPALHDGLGPAELRSSARDGLDAAIDDPSLDREFDRALTQLLADPEVVDAIERSLARISAAPEAERATARFFAHVQATDALREALAEYAGQHPEYEVEQLAAGFVSHVDARLTRPEVAGVVREELNRRLGSAGASLGRTLLVEGEGVGVLAQAIADVLVDSRNQDALAQRLGSDREQARDRLHLRLRDDDRMIELLLAFAKVLREVEGRTFMIGLIDAEALAPTYADSLVRVLDSPEFRGQAEVLFSIALAPELDEPALRSELGKLLDLPVVTREAEALLSGLGRDERVREAVRVLIEHMADEPAFVDHVLDALD